MATPDTDQSPDLNVQVVKRFIDEVINKNRLELIGELWAPDMVWRGGSLGEVVGIEAYAKMRAGTKRGRFEGLDLEILDIFTKDDKVLVQFTNSGRRVGKLLGMSFKSKHATWNGVGIYTVRDGKIAEAWFVEDVLAMMTQVGVRGFLNLITSGRG
jgi:predicted ester cyclase